MSLFFDSVIETQNIQFTMQDEKTVTFTGLTKLPKVVVTPHDNDVNIFIKDLTMAGCTLVSSTAITGNVDVTAIVKM